jgi:DNA-binding NarL/FixJ family response regulator
VLRAFWRGTADPAAAPTDTRALRLVELATQPAPPHLLPDDLTAREAEVLTLIAQGRSNHDIAAHLVVSASTVKTHINRIFSKTRCRDRAQLVAYAYAHKLASRTTTEPF